MNERSAPPDRKEAVTALMKRRAGVLVFALALVARLAVVAWAAPRIPPTADGTFYHTIAGRIAEGLGYTWLWPDGAVTHAGHYPIGYPALVAAAYRIAGPAPAAAMLLNALVGSFAAGAAFGLAKRAGGDRAGVAAGVLVALHPGLLAYTPALMTEGVTAALVACAAWAAGEASARRMSEQSPIRAPWRWLLVTGALAGLATLVRPQSIVLAPVFGALAAVTGAKEQLGVRVTLARASIWGAAVLAIALAVCAPWTVRNCVAMKRCALVSHNGGWNLLIGTNENGGGMWAEVIVPPECREVFDEAEKDVCFGAAARRAILDRPAPWLALVPKKLAATFDYAGAGGWYLNAANGDAFPERAKITSGAVETVLERAMLIAALWVAARSPLSAVRQRGERGRRLASDVATLALALAGALTAFARHAWVGYVILGVLLLATRGHATATPAMDPERPMLPPATGAVLLSLAVTHAIFFGAGRYSLVAFPLVTAVAALSLPRERRAPASDQ